MMLLTKTILGRLFIPVICVVLQQAAIAKPVTSEDPSPYIRMHVNDAVQWHQWDAAVIRRAQKENKLILLSSGYYSCHWCHVMRDESFNHPDVAEILNRDYIAVKIDREMLPALDNYLVSFMNQSQGYAGWPLNVFVTPEGYPLTGLVYKPRDEFVELLDRLKSRWKQSPGELNELARNMFNFTAQQNAQRIKMSNTDLVQALLMKVQESMDELGGGIGQQAKFPMPYLMLSLLEIYEQLEYDWLRSFLVLTLQQMVNEGLHDAVGGGFFRYTEDPGWQQPHYEKMLYTNAAMVRLYLKASLVFDRADWLAVAEETLDFILREMRYKKSGYVSALTAQDTQNEEGGDYVWSEDELQRVLSVEQKDWVVQRSIRQTSDSYFPVGFWHDEKGREIRKKLLQRRLENSIKKDNKLVIAWNAYLLTVMIEVNRYVNKDKYVESINSLKKLLESKYDKPGKGSFEHLQDYVLYAEALWAWAEWQKDEDQKNKVYRIVDKLKHNFWSENGWHESLNHVIPRPGMVINLADKDLPASDAVLYRLLGKFPAAEQEKYKALLTAKEVDRRVVLQPAEYASSISARLAAEKDSRR